jgi:hypothetical protein
MMQIHFLVGLDGEEAHRKNGLGGTFFLEGAVIYQRDLIIHVKRFNAILLFPKTMRSDLLIRVCISECSQEGARTLSDKFGGAHGIC